jgi:hypothetical protein
VVVDGGVGQLHGTDAGHGSGTGQDGSRGALSSGTIGDGSIPQEKCGTRERNADDDDMDVYTLAQRKCGARLPDSNQSIHRRQLGVAHPVTLLVGVGVSGARTVGTGWRKGFRARRRTVLA